MATLTTNTGEETPGRIFIKDLPEGHADYDSWRYSLCAQVLRASPDPGLALSYLRELEDESVAFADLPTMLDPGMNRVDVSLFAAIVGACQKGIKAAEHLKTIQARAAFGCGRQALRVLDERHKHESTHLATKANSEIQKLTCAGLEDLGHFMASFRLYRHQMGTGEHKLTNAMGISLLKDKLRGLNELKATFALWAAGSSTDLNGLLQAIESIQAEYLDEIEKRNNRKAERAAAAAARGTAGAAKGPGKGKKGKDGKTKAKVTCGFCGKPNHDASQCWNNPQSASYRPQFAQKTGAHGAPSVPPGLSAASSASSGQPTAAAAQDALAKAFQDFLAKKFAGAAVDMPPEIASACAQLASGAWALDSGASRFVVSAQNSEDQHWNTLRACKSEVEGLTGVAQSNSTVDVEVPHLGRRNALVMDNSVNMACMGEACEDMGFHFYWPAYASKPHFWKDGEPEIPLVVHSRVPFLCNGADADAFYASVAQELGPNMIERLTPEFLKSLTDEFFQTLFDEFTSQAQLGELEPLACATTAAGAKSKVEHHCLTHLPADPNCPICVQAKITKKPAARKHEDAKEFAVKFGERIHCDLVGPTKASLNGETYAIVTRDEATGYPSVRPLRSKTAVETAAAWNDMYGGVSPPVLCCRTDNGGEFDAEFDTQLKQQRIRHERSLPYRPQTNARAERFHRTLAEGMRSLMLMSRLPYVFWAFCLAAFVYLYARSPTTDGGPSPFERRFDRVYDVSRRQPFGSACFFLEETSLQKFEPRGRLGVVLGYGRLESYVVLDYEHYVQSKGEARIVKTRDVRFMPDLRFPFLELREQDPDSMHWLARMFELVPGDLGPTADASGKCTCMWFVGHYLRSVL